MRGAVTIALSYNQFSCSSSSSSASLTSEHALMITTTIIVVLFSTMVFGSITKPLIGALLLQKPQTSDATENQSLEDLRLLFLEQGGSTEDVRNQGLRGASLRLLMKFPTSTVHHYWRKFDDRFMRPVFGGRRFVPFVPGSPTGAADPGSPAEAN